MLRSTFSQVFNLRSRYFTTSVNNNDFKGFKFIEKNGELKGNENEDVILPVQFNFEDIVGEKGKEEVIKEIFDNKKQFSTIRSLVIVKAKKLEQRNLLLSQLRTMVPKSGWNLSKTSDYLILGDVHQDRYKDFIETSRVLNNCLYDSNGKKLLSQNKEKEFKAMDNLNQPFAGYSKQLLPNCKPIKATSNLEWVDEICKAVVENYLHCKFTKWRVHLLTTSSPILERNYKRGLIEDEVVKKMKTISRKIHKIYNHDARRNFSQPFDPTETLIQVMFESNDTGYISVSTPPIREYFKKMVSHFPGGQCTSLYDKLRRYLTTLYEQPTLSPPIQYIKNKIYDPYLSKDIPDIINIIKNSPTSDVVKIFLPSRSFLKLLEIEIRYPNFPRFLPSQTVIDMGSSPGGWTLYSLLKQCKVVSIDKSPLDSNFIDYLGNENSNPDLVFLQQDALEFTLPSEAKQVDWLLSDMKIPSMKALEMLERWLLQKHCVNFIINLKTVEGDETISIDRFIKSNILPLTSYLNCFCLDSTQNKELTIFGTINMKFVPPKTDEDIIVIPNK